ncbi:MAG: deoxynucleoside kinase [Bacteroidota bacterium]
MNYLVIEGNIGAGKTSLVEKLSKEMGAKAIFEQFEDNPFLPKFYDNPERYSFPLELSFLADRYKQHKEELTDRDMFTPMKIADYYFSKSLIFASITLAEDEYRLYRQLYNIIHQNLPRPDLYVYLHAGVDQLIENINNRGRDYEKTISPSYLLKLQEGYFNYFKGVKNMKILVIDTRSLNFLEDKNDYNYIKNYIFNRDYDYGITRISDGKYY